MNETYREASIRVIKDHLDVCLRDCMASTFMEKLLPLLLPHVVHIVEYETDGCLIITSQRVSSGGECRRETRHGKSLISQSRLLPRPR